MYTLSMALHITDPEIEQKVRELAAERHESVTEVIGTAVTELRRRGSAHREAKPTVEEAIALIRSFPVGPVDYGRSKDEILGYASNGACE